MYTEAPPREGVVELEESTREEHLDLSQLPVPVEDDEEFNRVIEECATESCRVPYLQTVHVISMLRWICPTHQGDRETTE